MKPAGRIAVVTAAAVTLAVSLGCWLVAREPRPLAADKAPVQGVGRAGSDPFAKFLQGREAAVPPAAGAPVPPSDEEVHRRFRAAAVQRQAAAASSPFDAAPRTGATIRQ